jgi:hypothetical protein
LSGAVFIEGAVKSCGRLPAKVRDTGETTEFDSGPILYQKPNEEHVLGITGGSDFTEVLNALQQILIFFLFFFLHFSIKGKAIPMTGREGPYG